MYKKGLSKTKFKQTMKMFWTKVWKYEKTPEQWVSLLKSSSGVVWFTPNVPWGKKCSDLLFSAIDKLVLERKLKKDEGENLKKMIASSDLENALVAITIMAALKPKKFKKVKNEKIN